MELSVLIPTHGRPEQLRACLDHLLPQIQASQHEVIVGVDGGGDQGVQCGALECLEIACYPKIGYIEVRRELMSLARGRVVLWLNDDSYAQPGLVRSHLDAHQASEPRVVVGHSPWARIASPTLFDRLIAETDLVFFQKSHSDEPYAVGYRDCYGLNMSFPRMLAEEVGGVPSMPDVYGYDDIELAYRMSNAGAVCWYAPDAAVVHDHQYTPVDIHRREYQLGRAAWSYAIANPEFAAAIFGCDLQDQGVHSLFEASISTAWRDATRIERSFLGLSQLPPQGIDERLLPMLAEHWVLLKRVLWRWGVLDAARGIAGRWSFLRETTPDQVLRPIPDPV